MTESFGTFPPPDVDADLDGDEPQKSGSPSGEAVPEPEEVEVDLSDFDDPVLIRTKYDYAFDTANVEEVGLITHTPQVVERDVAERVLADSDKHDGKVEVAELPTIEDEEV